MKMLTIKFKVRRHEGDFFTQKVFNDSYIKMILQKANVDVQQGRREASQRRHIAGMNEHSGSSLETNPANLPRKTLQYILRLFSSETGSFFGSKYVMFCE